MFATFCLLRIPVVYSQSNVNVTFTVGETNAVFEGYTSPNSLIVFMESNSIIGTATSDSTGFFMKTFYLLDPGLHEYTLYAVDPESTQSSAVTYSVAIPGGVTTTISNIVLPTSIKVSGGTLLSGYSVPGSSIEIYLDGVGFFTLIADPFTGYWEYDSLQSVLETGIYYFTATSTFNTYTSPESYPVVVSIDRGEEDGGGSNDGGDIGEGDGILLPPGGGTGGQDVSDNLIIRLYPHLDLNRNGIIDSEEGDLAIEAWIDSWKVGFVGRCDLNDDGICDIIDFSIFLYYINR